MMTVFMRPSRNPFLELTQNIAGDRRRGRAAGRVWWNGDRLATRNRNLLTNSRGRAGRSGRPAPENLPQDIDQSATLCWDFRR